MKKESRTYFKFKARKRRAKAIRMKISGDTERPRLVVFRSTNHIYSQIIDDNLGKTLVSESTLSKDIDLKETKKRTDQSFQVGLKLAEKAIKAGIKQVRFDRNGYLYHGRVKALAEGARKAGLKF